MHAQVQTCSPSRHTHGRCVPIRYTRSVYHKTHSFINHIFIDAVGAKRPFRRSGFGFFARIIMYYLVPRNISLVRAEAVMFFRQRLDREIRTYYC